MKFPHMHRIGEISDCPACAYEEGRRAGLEEAASLAEDCIANGVVVLSAGEVGNAIRSLKKKKP